MKLVIAEKPSVANTIATVLSADKKGVNYFYNDYYIVSWCVGHLIKLDDPDSYGAKFAEKPWKFENLPIIPEKWKFSIAGSTKSQYYVLKSLMERDDVDEIICATDAGREGECIFRYVYNKTGCQKPVKRLWTSSLEEKAIKKAFSEMKDDSEYDNLYQAGLARNKADWLVGMNATRLFSVRYGLLLNIGRVQTSTLAMIVDRNNKVNNFVKESFYRVDIDCGGFKATSEDVFESEYKASKLADCVNNTDFKVVNITEQKKSVSPPKLYDLTALQRDANSVYGYTAQQTLDYLQSLYEKKLATYPRTDSNYITDDMATTAKNLIESIYSVYEKIPHTPTDIAKVINNAKVSDHHALLPTDKGIQLIDCVPDDVKSPKMTAEWETALQHIENGSVSSDDFINQIEDSVKYLVDTYSEVDNSKHFTRWECVGICPVCGKKVLSYPKSYSCESKECNFNIWKNICGKSLTSAQAVKLLDKGKTDTLKGLKSKSGKSFDAAIKLNSDFKTEFVFSSSSKSKKFYRK